MHARNISPFMAPLITIGAITLLWRKAATKVVVSQLQVGLRPPIRRLAVFDLSGVGADCCLVEKDHPGRIKHALLDPTSARAGDVRLTA
jgi:hypothetical protein